MGEAFGESTRRPLHVVAGVLRDSGGRVLLAQRPADKHHGGLWEFPGGKADPEEPPVDALARELREELGIVVESARPLIRIPCEEPDQSLVLDVWRVQAWSGVPVALEGQRLAWVALDQLHRLPMPPADRPVVSALRLPDRYLITPAAEVGETPQLLAGIERACARGLRLIQIRQPGWTRTAIAQFARAAREIAAPFQTQLLLSTDWQLASVLGLDGVHLPAAVAAGLERRPLPVGSGWVGVSCHTHTELDQARRLGADFVTLSPLFPTASHPSAETLGWEGFAELAARTALPAYALGGLDVDDLDAAHMAGGQGIAAIRGLWPAEGFSMRSEQREWNR